MIPTPFSPRQAYTEARMILYEELSILGLSRTDYSLSFDTNGLLSVFKGGKLIGDMTWEAYSPQERKEALYAIIRED